LISSTRLDDEPRYSPDGKRIVFTSDRSGSLEVWVCNSDGSNSVQLTFLGTPYHTAHPRWSPDGRFIAFTSNAGGRPCAYVVNSEGGKPARLPAQGLLEWSLSEWSRDGKWLYFGSNRSGQDQLWKMPWPVTSTSGAAVQVTRKGFTREAVESADAKSLFYLKGDGVTYESLWSLPVEGGEESQVLPSVLSNNFAVVREGIYFIPNVKPLAIRFLSFSSGREVTLAKLSRAPAWGFTVSPDGRWLLYSEWESANSDLMLVDNFR
jgi:Tol biopolymer transport system component